MAEISETVGMSQKFTQQHSEYFLFQRILVVDLDFNYFTLNIILANEEVLFYKNLDWKKITTPIKVDELQRLLAKSKYSREKINYLSSGFRNGFDMGYRGPESRKDFSENIPLRIGSPTELWNKVMKEVKECRYTGPYENPPFENFMQSAIGLVPKANKKTRLIFHLSFDFGKKP